LSWPVPELKTFALVERGGTSTGDPNAKAKQIAGGVGAEFSARGQNGLAKDDKTAQAGEAAGQGDFLGGEEPGIESTRCIECFARTEEKTAAGQADRRCEGADQALHDYAIDG